jgi:hypothetical protein
MTQALYAHMNKKKKEKKKEWSTVKQSFRSFFFNTVLTTIQLSGWIGWATSSQT